MAHAKNESNKSVKNKNKPAYKLRISKS